MTIDVAAARADTPGCEHVVHLNNAGASLMPRQVLETTIGHLELEAREGGYEAADLAASRLNGVYESIARLIRCDADEVALIENPTRAWDMAFYALPLKPGARILTGEAEYASNVIAFLQRARQTGAVIEVVPSDDSGQLSVSGLADRIDERTALIAISHVPTNGGLVNPAAEVGALARQAGVPYLLDACQSVGQMPVRVDEIGCDFLSSTGRKYLRGPRGTGFLYARREWCAALEPPFLDLYSATWTQRDDYVVRPGAKRFENWERNVAGVLGLGAAADYAMSWGLEAIEERVRSLADGLRRRLSSVPGARVLDVGEVRCGIVSFSIDDRDPHDLQAQLRAQKINVVVSTASSTRYDMEARGIDSLVRASVHYFNTEEELDLMCRAVSSAAA